MRQSKIFLGFIFVFFTLITNVAFADQSSPVGLLQYIADNMIRELKQNKATLKTKPGIVYNLAYKYVVPYAALPEMSKRVIPPQVWNSASSDEKAQFQKEFTRTLIRTYASALTSYKDQTVEFYPPRGGSANSVEVCGVIKSPETDSVSVTYRLIKKGGSWRLFDMSVEGVDMLESFRAQYSDILATNNMTQLLERMKGHNNR